MTTPEINSSADALRWLESVYELRCVPKPSAADVLLIIKRGLERARCPFPPPPYRPADDECPPPVTARQALALLVGMGRVHDSLSGDWVRNVAACSLTLLVKEQATPARTIPDSLDRAMATLAPSQPTYQELADALTNVMAGHAHCYPAARELVKQLQAPRPPKGFLVGEWEGTQGKTPQPTDPLWNGRGGSAGADWGTGSGSEAGIDGESK